MRWIDDLLIDHVFQPIADAMARWLSCYGIAAFLLTGAILALFADLCFISQWANTIADLSIIFLCTTWMLRAHQLDRSSKRDVLSTDRIFDIFARTTYLILTIVLMPLVFITSTSFNMKQILWNGSYVLQTFALYFMACRPNPPKRQTKSFWWWIPKAA